MEVLGVLGRIGLQPTHMSRNPNPVDIVVSATPTAPPPSGPARAWRASNPGRARSATSRSCSPSP